MAYFINYPLLLFSSAAALNHWIEAKTELEQIKVELDLVRADEGEKLARDSVTEGLAQKLEKSERGLEEKRKELDVARLEVDAMKKGMEEN